MAPPPHFRSTIFLLCFILIAISCSAVAGENTIGVIKTVSGEVFIQQKDMRTKATINMKIFTGDFIITGEKSYAGLIFVDDTVVSLGPNSEISIKDFLFKPAEKQLSFWAKILKGTFSFLSGQISKLAPENVRIETPDATLAVRGTKFIIKVD